MYRCCDVETTGFFDKKEDATPSGMMEIAWCDLKEGVVSRPTSHLVDCGIPVTIEARAVHHISDEMVLGEMRPDEACRILAEGDHRYLVAHNTDHESHYVGPGVVRVDGEDVERQWLCTYKIALRLWPDAPGHKLQELRYFLKLDEADGFESKLALPSHRAGPDAYVGCHLLRKVLAEAVVQNIDHDRMVKWSKGPALLYMCFLKKHKGTPWSQVPKDYLSWIVNKSDITDRDIGATAKFYLAR